MSALEDLKAVDIRVLDVSALTTITDVMVIATGTSNRHAASLAHHVIDRAKESGHRPVGVEGLNEGEWVLVNLGGDEEPPGANLLAPVVVNKRTKNAMQVVLVDQELPGEYWRESCDG